MKEVKFEAKLPRHNDNITKNSLVADFLILLAGFLAFIFLIYLSLSYIIEFAVKFTPIELEKQILQNIDFIKFEKENTQRERYAEQLLLKLNKCANLKYKLELFVHPSKTPNAMALPNGKVVINSALFKNIQSENGLAFVLAHELGHFINKDHLKSLGKGIVMATFFSLITSSNSFFTNFFASTLNLANAKYSQKQESNADKKALWILNCHYNHVGGATELFQSISTSKHPIMHYFSSHPETKERIKQINKLIKTKKYQVLDTQIIKIY